MDIRIMFSKHAPAWKKTIYIVGLPRSGKSTVYNILSSCKHVEALEEPFDLLAVAQKSSQYSPHSDEFSQYHDLYLAFMEHNFSELVLGRNYNFRKQDKSCIFNYKSIDSVDLAHSRARRVDVLNYAKNNDTTFVIAFNDIERSINFIGMGVPDVQFIYVRRNILEVARDIASKEWLSNSQLSTQANMAPAYSAVVAWEGQSIYLPYLIEPKHRELFLSLDVLERSIMYAILQEKALKNALEVAGYTYRSLLFEDMMQNSEEEMNLLIQQVGLEKTEITNQNIEVMTRLSLTANAKSNTLDDLNLSAGLRKFINENVE